MVAEQDGSGCRQIFPFLQGILIAVINFLEAQLRRQDVSVMAEDEIVAERIAMGERVECP